MSQRIQKEREMLPYPVEVKEERVWIVSLPSYKVKVTFPSHYPFEAPSVEILVPITLALYLDYTWGAATRIQSVIESLEKRLGTLGESVNDKTKQTIKKANAETNELTLLMGSCPAENRRGRCFYEDTSVYLLDRNPVYEAEVDYSRYFEVDFTDHMQLGYLATQMPGRFKTICFDQSTVKFFETQQKTLYQRLVSLKGLLEADGRIYMELPGAPGGVRMVGDATNYYEIFMRRLEQAGFDMERKQVTQLEEIPIIGEVFLTGTYRTPCIDLLILKKKV